MREENRTKLDNLFFVNCNLLLISKNTCLYFIRTFWCKKIRIIFRVSLCCPKKKIYPLNLSSFFIQKHDFIPYVTKTIVKELYDQMGTYPFLINYCRSKNLIKMTTLTGLSYCPYHQQLLRCIDNMLKISFHNPHDLLLSLVFPVIDHLCIFGRMDYKLLA
jgi:hypothetical protein